MGFKDRCSRILDFFFMLWVFGLLSGVILSLLRSTCFVSDLFSPFFLSIFGLCWFTFWDVNLSCLVNSTR